VILAGGLSPENVYGAVKAVQPFGVDSCTGTNQVDRRGKGIRFKKDPARVKAFVQEVRRAEKDLDDLERPKEEKESI
jgi:phosphoribosylanthranilate isomerase